MAVTLVDSRRVVSRLVALPFLTAEQRKQAAEKAAQARRHRADLRAELKGGSITLAGVLERAQTDEALARMRVLSLLEALPGIGKTKAEAAIDRHQIAASRRIRGLGPHQRQSLIQEFG